MALMRLGRGYRSDRVAQDVDPAGRTDAGCSLDVEVGTCATDRPRRACLAALRSFVAAATRLKPVNQLVKVNPQDSGGL
jgi:hypothetical protein